MTEDRCALLGGPTVALCKAGRILCAAAEAREISMDAFMLHLRSCVEGAKTATPSDEKLLWGVVHNAGRLRPGVTYRWVAVMEAVGCGSTTAKTLCERFGADPDERVGDAGSGGDDLLDGATYVPGDKLWAAAMPAAVPPPPSAPPAVREAQLVNLHTGEVTTERVCVKCGGPPLQPGGDKPFHENGCSAAPPPPAAPEVHVLLRRDGTPYPPPVAATDEDAGQGASR